MLFRKAIELDPEFAFAHRELGWLLMGCQEAADAEQHLRKAIELNPNDAWAHVYFGSYLWGGDVNSAATEFHIALRLQPKWTVPLWSLGKLYEFVAKDLDLALSYFEKALHVDPEDSVALPSLVRLCKKRGLVAFANAYLDRAITLNPKNEVARSLLSE